MSFSFGWKKKSAPAKKVQVQIEKKEEEKELITEITENKITEDESKKRVIQLEESRIPIPKKKRKLNSEEETKSDEPKTITTGLSIKKDLENNEKKEPEEQQESMLARNRNHLLDNIEDEDEKFKVDVNCRPDSATDEEYESMPVSEFGAALLRGMGWKTGESIGRNGPLEPFEVKKREGKHLGLGAKVAPEIKPQKKYIKPGETRN